MREDLKINKTRIVPLRWFANACGDIAGWAILRISYLDELENFGWRYKLHSFIWKITWPIYYKFGTFYEFDFDMSGDGWNDYDEDGVPYWEKTGCVDPDYCEHNSKMMIEDQWDDYDEGEAWDFIDPVTKDAYRRIESGE